MIEYKYRNEIGKIKEIIKRPVADIEILGRDENWYWVTAYIDSGADISIIPYSLGLSLSFTLKSNNIIEMTGVSGKGIPIVLVQTKINYGKDIVRDAEIGWALVEGVPVLLGRHTVFDKFHVTFKENEGTVLFEPI